MANTLTSQNYTNTKSDIFNDRQNIYELQKFLQKIGEKDNRIPFISTDGIHGAETADAVRSFQSTRGIEATGVADYVTWEAIAREYENIMKAEGPPLPFEVFPVEILEIKAGDRGDVVVVIQLILNSLSNQYANLTRVIANGQYNTETTEAVSNFQNSLNMTPTGVVDRNTWNELIRLYRGFLINK